MGICESKEDAAAVPSEPSEGFRKGEGSNVTDKVQNVGELMTNKFRTQAHHLKNVFAAPIEMVSPQYKPPVFEKSSEEQAFIKDALKHNFVFEGVSDKEFDVIIAAHEPYDVDKNATIIMEGDKGDYFYVLREGRVKFVKGDNQVGKGREGASFGELALLYSAPRAASVISTTPCKLYRLDQITFRSILQSHTLSEDKEKMDLLRSINFLQDLDPRDVHKLAAAMKPRNYQAGATILNKGDEGDVFYVIVSGKVRVTDITAGNAKYEDLELGKGRYFGERALITNEKRAATIFAVEPTKTLTIDKKTFVRVLGDYGSLVLRKQDKLKLSGIKIIQDSSLESSEMEALAGAVKDQHYTKGEKFIEKGQETKAALYLVRKGQVQIKDAKGKKRVVDKDGYFGEEMLTIDMDTLHGKGEPVLAATYSAKALEDCTLGVLTIKDARKLVDTTSLGISKEAKAPKKKVQVKDLEKHKILGAGTFGQVWLVSEKEKDKSKAEVYALKIQSKYDLIQNNQAKGVVNEKNIMAKLDHPFILKLIATDQDPQRVYMVTSLVQGGELYSVLHTPNRDGVSEKEAKFYAAGVIEGLTYMHNKHVIYRDLKPENVLIDADGYPVIIDMGFAKYVTDKTYTLCGTPLYLPPEVILNRGHDKGADHWSFAVMTYEMMVGETPFYEEGMDQMALFKAIVKGVYKIPSNARMSPSAKELLKAMLVTDPSHRLGSLAEGSKGIYCSSWFSDINFVALRHKEIDAPWKPSIKNPMDGSNFEDWSHLKDKQSETYPALSAKEQAIFKTF
jgi:protein kinase A